MIKTAHELLTAEEFSQIPDPIDGSKQELIAGEIVSMPPPSFNHGRTQVLLATILSMFVEEHQLGQVTTESGMVTKRGPDSVRGPDVAYWSKERVPLDEDIAGYPDASPDICAEILSEPRRKKALARKLKEYFASGVRLVWVVDTEKRTVIEYRTASNGKLLQETDSLEGRTVLPGFSCLVSRIFTRRKSR